MCSGRRPEVFLDRSLGKRCADGLREYGWTVHRIAEFYGQDAQAINDEIWIAEGCARGWILFTKDQKIRYRAKEIGALHGGHLFCLSSGNLGLDEMTARFIAADAAILRAVEANPVGFWHVYSTGRIDRMWP
jgi:hypothetical protein